MNNIVAECVQAQKKTWKTVHVRRKNFAELKNMSIFKMAVLIILWQSVCKRRKKTWKTVHVRRKNVAELKKHVHFQNVSANNIVAVWASAEKKRGKMCSCGEKT